MAGLDDIHWDDIEDVSRMGARVSTGPTVHLAEDWPAVRGRWRLSSRFLTSSERSTLRSRFESARGGCGTTTWTPPGGSSTTVKFVGDSLGYRLESPDKAPVSIEIEEVL